MIHLPALLGYSRFKGLDFIIDKALADLDNLEKGGVDGIMVENEYDHPHQIEPGPEVIACFTVVVEKIVKQSKLPVGVEVLLNYPQASLAIAKVAGAKFIRTDFFVDEVKTEYGIMKIDPKGLMEFRKKIKAENIAIFADIQVKYSTFLKPKNIETSAKEAIAYSPEALIVTGDFTGDTPDLEDLIKVKKVAGDFPVLVGSGFNKNNAKELLKYADGAIVGTSIKTGGKVDLEKVRELMKFVD